MPRPLKEGDIIPSGSGTDRAASSESLPPIFSTVSNNMPLYNRQNSYQLGRVITSQSVTHDMSTGASREGAGRGYGFDQADDILPAQIRRYTSRSFLLFVPFFPFDLRTDRFDTRYKERVIQLRIDRLDLVKDRCE